MYVLHKLRQLTLGYFKLHFWKRIKLQEFNIQNMSVGSKEEISSHNFNGAIMFYSLSIHHTKTDCFRHAY